EEGQFRREVVIALRSGPITTRTCASHQARGRRNLWQSRQTRSTKGSVALSRKEPVDLGPHLGGIVVVGSVDLPSRAGLSLSLRGAPVNHGPMCPPQPRIWSPMHGHCHLPNWQGRRYHSSGERARYEQLDTNLDMWHIVPIQHDDAAASVDPACV